MSDYNSTFGGAAKDAANDTILGAQMDTEFDAIETMSATKGDKVVSATDDNLLSMDATGNLQDSGISAANGDISVGDNAFMYWGTATGEDSNPRDKISNRIVGAQYDFWLGTNVQPQPSTFNFFETVANSQGFGLITMEEGAVRLWAQDGDETAGTAISQPTGMLSVRSQGSVGSLQFQDDLDTLMTLDATGFELFLGTPLVLSDDGYIEIDEAATGPTNVTAKGLLWVRNDTPNTLMLTDDAGTEYQVAGGDGVANDNHVRLEERATAPTTSAGEGRLWVRDDAPTVLVFTDDTGSDTDLVAPGSVPSVVANHIRAGNIQIPDGSQTLTSVDNANNLMASNTWETFGATGSGATNIWTAMDVIPSAATILIVDVRTRLAASGNGANVNAYFAEGAITPTADDDSVRGCRILSEFESPAQTNREQHEAWNQVLIPLDSTNQTFQFKWTNQTVDSFVIDFHYRGFMTD